MWLVECLLFSLLALVLELSVSLGLVTLCLLAIVFAFVCDFALFFVWLGMLRVGHLLFGWCFIVVVAFVTFVLLFRF